MKIGVSSKAKEVIGVPVPAAVPRRNEPAPQPRALPPLRIATPADAELRVGVIHNALARHNVARHEPQVVAGCDHVMPRSHEELDAVLAKFAASGVNALVIDGGDGTVRDVITAAARHFTGIFPRIAILPSGKTNALALDLGIPRNWTSAEAVEAIRVGGVKERAPLELRRPGEIQPSLRGFIFGAGVFVRATELAQTTHRFGAFNGLAVGLSIFGAIAQTVFGGRENSWRTGERMRIAASGQDAVEARHYLLLGSTLTRMPLRIKPFGRSRAGLKLLRIEANPRRILSAVPAILRGDDAAWLPGLGYHRIDAEQVGLSLSGGFVLDGETFAGGEVTLSQGMPIRFVVP